MNILNVLNYSPEFGGGICKHLAALGTLAEKKGHRLYLAFPKELPWQKDLKQNSTVIVIPEILNPLWSGYSKVIRNYCRNYEIDILHIHFSFAQNLALSCSIKPLNIPVIYHWHNPPISLNSFFNPPEKLKGKIKKIYSTEVAKFADKHLISHHISISQNITNLLVQNKWTTTEKITLLPNAISNSKTISSATKEKCNATPIIGTVANFRPQKDHDTLIKAFNILIKSKINCELWLVGDGPTKIEIEKSVDELNLRPFVKFLGTLADPAAAYSKFDIFVLSTHYEGHPLVLMEAMCFGLPIVATKVSSIPEVISDRVDGILVNPKDPEDLANALKNLITDNDLYSKISKATLENFKKQLSYDEWAQKLVIVYEKLLNTTH
jgi:glycosyltransferase involved in cell wall biosynthesis